MAKHIFRREDEERTELLGRDELFVQKGKGSDTYYNAWLHDSEIECCPRCGSDAVKTQDLFSKTYLDLVSDGQRKKVIQLEYEFYKYRYNIKLAAYIEQLQELRKEAVSLATGIIGETLCMDDLFFCASVDRCIRLIDGLIPMLRDRNLTCVGVLLRIQMDNCMRTYAAFIAEDRNAVIRCILDGTPIKSLKDAKGNKMLDGYLKDEVAKIDPIFSKVYNNASGYVHLSEKAFYQTVDSCDNYEIGIQIGQPLPEKRNAPLLEAATAYIHFVNLHFKMLQAVVESKQRFDASQTENESQEV